MGRFTSACIFAALIAALSTGNFSCRDAARPSYQTQIRPAELAERIRAGAALLILDVRSRGEYAAGHIPGAINIPHMELRARLSELGSEKSDDVVVYCGGRGHRSVLAEEVLVKAGYTSVRRLEGQLHGWQRQGYRTE